MVTANRARQKTKSRKQPRRRAIPLERKQRHTAAKAVPNARSLSLALQGGGAHGAFTWGVLDRLLEDERIAIDGISGTSAGAMNGAVLVAGMAEGGRDRARELLRLFWRGLADAGRLSIFQPTMLDRAFGGVNLDFSPAYQAFDLMTRMLSPYQFNPLDYNPLRDLLAELVDFERLRKSETIKLFVCATNVRTGKIRVFRHSELTAEALLASSCLPHIFRAVEIDGEHYWDGGFMGNPAMFPLIYNCKASDIMLIEVNPIRIEELPTTSRAIIDRMNTISFNATMMREMRAIAFVTRLLELHHLSGNGGLKSVNFHMIQAEQEMAAFGVASNFNVDWDFLMALFELGRTATDVWLGENFATIGQRSSVDLDSLFF